MTNRFDREGRLIRAGLVGVCLGVPAAHLLTAAAGFPAGLDLSLFIAAAFALFAVSELSRAAVTAPGPTGWLNPVLPWSLLLALTVLMLFRSQLPETAAGAVLAGVAALLLYIVLDRHFRGRGGVPVLVGCFVVALAVLGGFRIADLVGTGAGAGFPSGLPSWPLITLPLALWSLMHYRSTVATGFHGLMAAVIAAVIATDPPPFGLTIVVIAAAAAIAAALIPGGRRSANAARSERRLSTFLVACVVILMLVALVFFNVSGIQAAFADQWPVEQLYQWELTLGIVQDHPLGVGPGNLNGELATHLVPPGPDDRPLEAWPQILVSDLLRLQAELGWLLLPLLLWGLAPIWALGLAAVRSETATPDRLRSAFLWMAVLTGTATIFLFSPFRSPIAMVGLCLAAALTTASGSFGPARAEGPVRLGRLRAVCAVVVAVVVAAACIRTVIADGRYRRGVEAFHRHDLDLARAAASDALHLRDGDTRARLLLAESLYAAGDWAAATRQYNILLEGQPNNARLSLRVLGCYRQEGFLREAIRLSERLAATWPTSKAIQTESARWLARDGRTDEAIERLQAVLEQDSQDYDAKFLLADLLESLGRDEEAVYYFRGAAINRPNDPAAFKRLGNNRYRAGKYIQAARYYNEAMRIDGNDADLLARAGAAYYMIRRYCDALDLMERGLEIGLEPGRRGAVQAAIDEIRPRCDSERQSAPRPDAGAPESP